MKPNINTFGLLIIILLLGVSTAYSQKAFEIYPAKGYCTDSVEYQGQKIASNCIQGNIHYTNSLFPHQYSTRSYILSSSAKYSIDSINYIEWIYDVVSNNIIRIDSSRVRHVGYRDGKEIKYMGIINDTLLYWVTGTDEITAERIPDFCTISLPQCRLEQISRLKYLHQKIHNGEITYYSLDKDLNLAYSNSRTNRITICTREGDSLEIMANMGGKVLGWLNETHLLYADISVEGFGDFYYDVFVLDVSSLNSMKVLSHVCNVYDYCHNQLIYELEPRQIVVAQLYFDNKWALQERGNFDLNKDFLWIYEMNRIDDANFVILGDAPGGALCLYKLHVASDL